MNEQNIENLLNLALEVEPRERSKSLNLDIGYDLRGKEWELIVKYSGSIEALKEVALQLTVLRNEYAIVRIRQEDMERFADLRQVEYIEKSKLIFPQMEYSKRVSCIDEVQDPFFYYDQSSELTGKGVLVGLIDTGIAYRSKDYQREDGSSRILAFWDQSIDGTPPSGYHLGQEYLKKDLDRFLQEKEPVPALEELSHGNLVAEILAGNGSESGKKGVAYEADLLVVKLGRVRDGGYQTSELMQAINYIVEKAEELGRPLALNLSLGYTYGSHDGSSLLSRFIDAMAREWKCVICVGTGNEGSSQGHAQGSWKDSDVTEIPFVIQPNQTTTNIQLWKEYVDQVEIRLIAPDGKVIGPLKEELGVQKIEEKDMVLFIYYGKPGPYQIKQEIYFDFIPKDNDLMGGKWILQVTPIRIVSGQYALWFPSESTLMEGTGFLESNPEETLTIPSTAQYVVAVGAYDARRLSYAAFSGRGRAKEGCAVKPDLVAPGVEIAVAVRGKKEVMVSGTSFATPFVTGAAALLMEWGIVKGNDPYLYGEKVKAYLHRGARELPGFSKYPNNQIGFGALCLKNSLLI